MTTIPIEVIVQDASAPVVPGEDGTNNTETNIAVPDTGEGNGGIFTGSASTIILPAILLVLAIGSIVAILIHKYHKQKKDKTTRKEKLAVAASSTIAILAVTVLIGNLVIPATKAATGDIEDGIVPSEDKVSIVVTRDGGSAEESIETKATITSTSDFGYKVLLSMAEEVETSNLYLDGDENSKYYIAPVGVGDEEGAELTDNTWGYALTEDGGYSAMPLLADAVVVAEGDEPVEDEELSIYYGVKVSSDLPAGTYSGGEIEYTLTDNGFPSSLTTMQGMTSEICESIYTPNAFKADGATIEDNVPTATLTDIRDNKTYTVAKLADGKCWMTQNLDLDLKTDGTIMYDSTNTNLTIAGSGAYVDGYTTENDIITWTPANATIDFTGSSVSGWTNSNTTPYSANPNDVYYYTSNSSEADTFYGSLELCMKDHAEAYCTHYHAGNYYNWSAAAASNDTSSLTTEYDNATNSICPKGWRLPVGGNSNNAAEGGELFILLNKYYHLIGDLDKYQGISFYHYKEGALNAIRISPLWLARAGFAWYGSLNSASQNGLYTSSTISPSTTSVFVQEIQNTQFRSNSNPRSSGVSIRCITQ